VSSTVRPDNVKAALDAKLAAAMSQLVELREAEQPATLHLNPREIIDAFLLYACRVQPIAETFGREQAGDLQFDAWYGQWVDKLSPADRKLWQELNDANARRQHGQGAALIEVEAPAAADASAHHADVRRRSLRFAAWPKRAASDVCADYLRMAKRLAGELLRDYARFLR
jgi:hypothetical protein